MSGGTFVRLVALSARTDSLDGKWQSRKHRFAAPLGSDGRWLPFLISEGDPILLRDREAQRLDSEVVVLGLPSGTVKVELIEEPGLP
jgi:hypothetical protein